MADARVTTVIPFPLARTRTFPGLTAPVVGWL
jgi:hypothetical protein